MARHHPDLIMCRKQPGVCEFLEKKYNYSPVAACVSLHSSPPRLLRRANPLAAIGRLCEKCDGKCVICDSYVRPTTPVRVCDECNFGSYCGRCVICGAPGSADAFYCKECTQQEKDVRALRARGCGCAGSHVMCVRAANLPLSSLLHPSSCAQRDGCPKVINVGAARAALYYESKKYAFTKKS